jgi:hypothetical protein
MSTYGVTGSLTYSVSYPSLDAMMTDLKDNSSGAIQAIQLRNSVLTLWDMSGSGSASSNSIFYGSNTASTIAIGGLPVGTSFNPAISFQQLFDSMFHPYVAPIISSLSLGNSISGPWYNQLYLENGTSLSNNIYINWNIIQGSILLSSVINSIKQTGNPYFRYNGNATQYYNVLATQSGIIIVGSQSNSTQYINLIVNDGLNSITATVSVTFLNKFYWGNFATNPATYSWSNSDISNLNGASVSLPDIYGVYNSGNILTNTKTQTLNGINGSGNYLVFAFPNSFGTPVFVTNGLVNTAFGFASVVYTNTHGVTQSYSIWYSNTVQNSPITYFQIN